MRARIPTQKDPLSSNPSDPRDLDPRSREALLYAEADRLAAQGRFPEAIVLLESVRGSVAVDVLLGTLFTVTGEVDRAAELLASALARGAKAAEVCPILGEVYLMKGALAQAIETFRTIPEQSLESSSRGNLALALMRSGDARAAVATLEASPARPLPQELATLLGEALCGLEEWARGAEVYEQLLGARTIDVDGMVNLAFCWTHVGRYDEAEQAAALVLAQAQLTPATAASAASVRGMVARARGDASDCDRFFAYAAQLEPANPVHLNNYADLGVLRAPGESERLLRRAVEFDPEYGNAWLTLGNALRNQGRVDEALGCFERAASVEKPAPHAGSALAYSALFLPDEPPSRTRERHEAACARLPEIAAPPFVAPASKAGERLRLGFVSDDLAEHPVGYFVVAVLEQLAREHDLFVYGRRRAGSAIAERLAATGLGWREPRSDAELVELARADRLDVAFDLMGHCAGTRLAAFAARLAPLQAAWAGYMATTGLSTMDLLVADAWHVPPGAEPHYVERVLRMPNAFVAYEPPAGPSPSRTLPVDRLGALTLGSFHVASKLCSRTLDTFAAALLALPTARLLLKTSSYDCLAAREAAVSGLLARGVATERLAFFGHSTPLQHMQALDLVDVALDPRTFSGSTVTLECLAMGVPVVTCPGESFSSRHSTAFLSAAGHADWVVGSTDEYVAKVVALAHDTAARTALRQAPREALLASKLCDAKALASALISGLRAELARA